MSEKNQISKEDQQRKLNEAMLQVYNDVSYVQKQKAAGLNYTIATEASFIALLRPAMVKAGLTVSCKVSKIAKDEVTMTGNGKQSHRVVLENTYVFNHADGGSLEVMSHGEAKDSGDKAFAKAATIALKYALRQSFMIETGDDPDCTPSEEHALPEKPAAQNRQNPQEETVDQKVERFVVEMRNIKNINTLNQYRADCKRDQAILTSPNVDVLTRKLEGNYFVRRIDLSRSMAELDACRAEYSASKRKDGVTNLFAPENIASLETKYWQKEKVLSAEEAKAKEQQQEPDGDEYPGR